MVAERIGPYKILRPLGQGGMGEVFEAMHETIERRVAIKVLRADRASDAETSARFFNEARAVNRIDHPGLVQVSDYGETPEGATFIVMELLRGETLAQRLRREGKLPLSDALRLCRQAASALAAAHDKGIIHRDIKPANMMIVADPEAPGGERLKVLDFGIAKLTADVDAAPFTTQSDVLLGTPRYMSPEQCRGNREVDDRSDVYSLGIVLYLMLSGRPPFEGSGGELIAMHIYEPVPPLGPLVADAPPELIDLCHRMLSKNKQIRPSMRQALAAMETLGAVIDPAIVSSRILPPAPSAPVPPPSATPSPSSMPVNEQLTVDALPPRAPKSASAEPKKGDGAPAAEARGEAGLVAGAALSADAASELAASGDAAAGGRRSALWVVAAAVAVAAVAAGVGLRQSGAGPAAAAAPSASQARLVRWSLSSQPPGAEVVRASDGAVLGVTPWSHEQPAETGSLQLRLRLGGFVERRLTLDQARDASRDEILDAAAPSASAPAAATAAPSETKKDARPGRAAPPSKTKHGRIDVED